MSSTWPIRIALVATRLGFLVGRIDRAVLRRASTFFLFASAEMPAEVLRRRLPGDISLSRLDGFVAAPGTGLPALGVGISPTAPPPELPDAGACFELDRASPFFTPADHPGFSPADGVVPDPDVIPFAIHVGDEYPGLRLELWAWSDDAGAASTLLR
jgi:type VI secretion system protein ImpJ